MKSMYSSAFDLNLLRMLIGIYELKSVSQAGARLGLSQPASSNALARLRQALDDPLFLRTPNGMLPTAYAQRILPDVREHLAGLDVALDRGQPFDPAESHRVFHLSLSGLGEVTFLPQLAIAVLKAAPHVRIANVGLPVARLGDALERGEVDLALGMVEITQSGVLTQSLYEETYVAVAGDGLRNVPKTLSDLKKQKIVLPAPVSTFGKSVDEILARHSLTDSVVLRLAHFGVLTELLRQLDVIAIVPREHARQLVASGQCFELGLELSPHTTSINLVWHRRTENDPACQWLRELIIGIFARAAG